MSDKEKDIFEEIDNYKNPNEYVDAEDPIAEAMANGEYDDVLNDDGLDNVMDFDEDDVEEDSLERQDELVNAILSESEGVDEDGKPKASIAVEFQMHNVYDRTSQPLSSFGMTDCVAYFNKRYEFVEIVFEFKSHYAGSLKSMWDALEKYGKLYNQVTEESQDVPIVVITVMPFSGMGTVYLQAMNPVSWSLSAKTVDGEICQIRALFHEEDFEFVETDDVNMTEILAAEERRAARQDEMREAALAKEEERRQFEERRQEKMAEMRKKGFRV